MDKKCIVSAQFGEQNQSFLTAILEIDEKNKEIKLDCAPTEQLNRQLLTAAKVLFRSEIEGIKVSFRGQKLKKVLFDGLPALAMPLPDAVFWLQRRNFFRVRIPQSHIASFCRVNFTFQNPEGEFQVVTKDFKLLDLGIRGFAILNPDPAFKQLNNDTEQTFQGTLFLHEKTTGNVSFVVKYTSQIRTSPTAIQQRVGCSFTDISQTFESNLQLYMQDIERQFKKIS